MFRKKMMILGLEKRIAIFSLNKIFYPKEKQTFLLWKLNHLLH
jgi:hypothetical protein